MAGLKLPVKPLPRSSSENHRAVHAHHTMPGTGRVGLQPTALVDPVRTVGFSIDRDERIAFGFRNFGLSLAKVARRIATDRSPSDHWPEMHWSRVQSSVSSQSASTCAGRFPRGDATHLRVTNFAGCTSGIVGVCDANAVSTGCAGCTPPVRLRRVASLSTRGGGTVAATHPAATSQ